MKKGTKIQGSPLEEFLNNLLNKKVNIITYHEVHYNAGGSPYTKETYSLESVHQEEVDRAMHYTDKQEHINTIVGWKQLRLEGNPTSEFIELLTENLNTFWFDSATDKTTMFPNVEDIKIYE